MPSVSVRIFLLGWMILAPARAAVLLSAVESQGASADDEFVEIYNSGSETCDLTGWKLRYQSSTGTWSDRLSFRTNLPAGSFYLIGGSAYLRPVPADIQRGLSISASSSGFSLALVNAQGQTIDLVGCGTAGALAREKNLAPAPLGGECLVRKAWAGADGSSMAAQGCDFLFGKGHDSDDNLADWVRVRAYVPKNSVSPPEPVQAPLLDRATGFTNSQGSWVTVGGSGFLIFQQGISRLVNADGQALAADFTEPGAFWSNEGLRFRFPEGLARVTPCQLVRRGPGGGEISHSMPPLAVAPPQITETLPSLDSLERGQPVSLRATFLGSRRGTLRLSVDGRDLSDDEVISWADALISFILPVSAKVGSVIQWQNPATLDTLALEITGLGNGPPILGPGCLSLSRKLAGPGVPVTARYFRRDLEGDAPLDGFPLLNWGEGQAAKLEIHASNEYRAVFTPAQWAAPGRTELAFEVADASATGATRLVRHGDALTRLSIDWEAPRAPSVFRCEETAHSNFLLLWEAGEPDLASRTLRLVKGAAVLLERSLDPGIRSFSIPDFKTAPPLIALLRSEDNAGNLGPWSECRLTAVNSAATGAAFAENRIRRGEALRIPELRGGSELRLFDFSGHECWRYRVLARGEVEIPAERFQRAGLMLLVCDHPQDGRRTHRFWVTP
jgi:hypothetical protein